MSVDTSPKIPELINTIGLRRRVIKSTGDPLFFLRYYIPEYFHKPWGEFHYECSEIFLDIAKENSRARYNIVAPRSVAKSMMFSVGLPTFAALLPRFCKKHFIILIADTFGQAVSKIEAVKNILESSEPLREDFGDVSTQFWSTERIIAKSSQMIGFGGLPKEERNEAEEKEPTPRLVVGGQWEGTLIMALGTGMKIRGRTFRQWRPDLIILDDPQNDEQVASPVQRKKTMEWLYDAVLPAGSVDGCAILTLGTALHEECMVEDIRQNDLTFESRLFKMVKSWPERNDLWEQCRKTFIDLSLGEERKEKAVRFYQSHRKQMDKGYNLLQYWASDVREEVARFDVMVLMWTGGASFWRERQNEPSLAGERLFNWDRFIKFSKHLRAGQVVFEGKDGKKWSLADYTRIAIGIDPAEATPPGRQRRGDMDFCAIAAMGQHTDGYRDVLEVRLSEEGAEAEIDNTLDFFVRWSAGSLYIEANMYQGLASLIRNRAKERGIAIRISPIKQSGNKEVRIASLEPAINPGWIRFTDDMPMEARNQFNRFRAGAAHDDAPDVIEMVDKQLSRGQVRYVGDFSEVMGKKKKQTKEGSALPPDIAFFAGERKHVGDTIAPVCEKDVPYDSRNINSARNTRLLTYCQRFQGCVGCPIAKGLKWTTPVTQQFIHV